MVVADLFCGAGGLSLGFATARVGSHKFQLAFGVDTDKDCMETYRANLLKGVRKTERATKGARRTVRGLSGQELLRAAGVRRIDVLIGGPNCQAVSSAGLRNPDDDRNDMFGEFVRLVSELRPRWFVLENVPGLTHRNNLPLLRAMLERLSRLKGYRVAADVLLASNYGVAQHRYRLFVIGTRARSAILFPSPTHGADRRPLMTVRQAIGDLDRVAPDGRRPGHVRSDLDTPNLRRIRAVPSGGDWRDMPIRLLPQRHFHTRASDQKGTYGRLRWEAPAFTITGLFPNVTAGPFVHPRHDRALTPREAARLQGFPDTFTFEGSWRSWARQIGNAVPPPLAHAIAKEILAAERGTTRNGVAGRLTLAVVRDAERGRVQLPILTPRVGAEAGFGRAVQRGKSSTAVAVVWPKAPPPDARRLEAEARLPAFTWTGKRARAIRLHSQHRSVAQIAVRLRLSEATIRRWITGYRRTGAEGWRAYHTSLDHMAGGDARVLARLEHAVAKVRDAHLGVEEGRRPHMNAHVRRLAAIYGRLSVRQLIEKIKRETDVQVGTVYVADLLAIADVLLRRGRQHRRAA
jgi:site-specific DNA-cytosine methylase